ncbi:MAG: ABC transporter substrate-binding protein [Pseudomonadota bacterium]|nr:ABC transporter substrate-binding protein [Pseudomonadota bacterium]
MYRYAVFIVFTLFSVVVGAQQLTFNLGWLPQGSLSGVIIAIELGYYTDVGLDVDAVRGYGGVRTVNEIDQGRFALGYGDPISVALNRARGGEARLVSSINTRWPAGLCFVRENHEVEGLDDIAGFTMGGGSGSTVHNLIPVWLDLNNLPRNHLRMLRMDPAVVDVSLIEGGIDLAECWRGSNRAVIQKYARDAGVSVGWLEYADYGVDMYGSGIVSSDPFIQENPDTVGSFIQATYRGYAYAITNPERATEILLSAYSTLDPVITAQQVTETADLIIDPVAGNSNLGWFREDRMLNTMGFIDRAFDLDGEVQAEDLYTNQFVR